MSRDLYSNAYLRTFSKTFLSHKWSTWQALLLTVSYSLWWIYVMFMNPVRLSEPLLFQNFVLLGSILSGLITLGIQVIIRQKVAINRQYLAWTCLTALSLTSLIWATDPVFGIQHLKFNIFLVGIGILTLNVILFDKTTNYWLYYIIGFSFLALVYASLLILEYGSLRAPPGNTNPNHYLVVGITVVPIAIHLFYHSKRIPRLFSSSIVLLAGAVFVFSQSRSAIPVIAVWSVGLLIFNHDQLAGWTYSRATIAIFSVFGITLTMVVFALDPTIVGRIYTQTVREVVALSGPISIEDPVRVRIYKFIGYLLTETKTYLTGVGYHNFNIEYASFTGWGYRNPHNAYIKSVVELGVLGFALFAAVVVYPLKYGLSTVRTSMTESMRSLAIALLWSYTGLLVFALFQPIRGHFQFYLLSAMLFGVLIEATDK